MAQTATRLTSMKLRSANVNDPIASPEAKIISSPSVVESEAILARAVPFIQDRLLRVRAREADVDRRFALFLHRRRVCVYELQR